MNSTYLISLIQTYFNETTYLRVEQWISENLPCDPLLLLILCCFLVPLFIVWLFIGCCSNGASHNAFMRTARREIEEEEKYEREERIKARARKLERLYSE